MNLNNIRGLRGADNMPGTAVEVLVAPKEWFDSIKKPAADSVEITQTHTFLPGKGFISIYNSLESGEFKSESKGGIDGRYQAQMYEGFVPGIRPVVMNVARVIQNVESITLIRDNNGNVIQIGSDEYPAYISFASKTGKVGGDDVAGYDMKVESYGIGTLFYKGVITKLPDGNISGGTGSFSIDTMTTGKAYKAIVSLGDITQELGSFAPQEGDDNAALAAGLAASINAAGITGVSATSAGAVLNGVFPSDYNGWSFTVVEASTFTGTAFVKIGAVGAEDDLVVFSLMYNGYKIGLGTYLRAAGHNTPTLVATNAALACSANPFNLTVTGDNDKVVFAVEDVNDPILDGAYLVVDITGTITDTSTLEERTF